MNPRVWTFVVAGLASAKAEGFLGQRPDPSPRPKSYGLRVLRFGLINLMLPLYPYSKKFILVPTGR